MSDIPRYRPVANDKYGITDDVDGKLCEYRDYARLKAEVERLRSSSFVTAVPVEEYEKLKAEVELLRKAGDALYESEIGYYGEQILVDPKHHSGELCRNWNAAKEGKQP